MKITAHWMIEAMRFGPTREPSSGMKSALTELARLHRLSFEASMFGAEGEAEEVVTGVNADRGVDVPSSETELVCGHQPIQIGGMYNLTSIEILIRTESLLFQTGA